MARETVTHLEIHPISSSKVIIELLEQLWIITENIGALSMTGRYKVTTDLPYV